MIRKFGDVPDDLVTCLMTDTVSDLRERSGQFRKRTTARSVTRSGECEAVQDFATTARGEETAHPRSGVYRDEAKSGAYARRVGQPQAEDASAIRGPASGVAFRYLYAVGNYY